MAYKHSLCRVCSTVCGQCLWDPPHACFAGSPHTASSATPWAALRADPKGQALAWHSLCTHAHTHMLAHMEWPEMHSPIPIP